WDTPTTTSAGAGSGDTAGLRGGHRDAGELRVERVPARRICLRHLREAAEACRIAALDDAEARLVAHVFGDAAARGAGVEVQGRLAPVRPARGAAGQRANPAPA